MKNHETPSSYWGIPMTMETPIELGQLGRLGRVIDLYVKAQKLTMNCTSGEEKDGLFDPPFKHGSHEALKAGQ